MVMRFKQLIGPLVVLLVALLVLDCERPVDVMPSLAALPASLVDSVVCGHTARMDNPVSGAFEGRWFLREE
jgi:hypothetical protein